MGVWQVALHVLSVWLVTSLSLKVKDAPRTGAVRFDKFVNLNSVSSSFFPDLFVCGQSYLIGTDYTVCGDGFCKCDDFKADCAFHHGNLTYIPTFLTNISWLGFSDNGLTAIPDDFFRDVTHLTYLDLDGNGLSNISAGAFKLLHQLTTLMLAYNKLTHAALAHVLSIPTLKQLDLSANELGPLPDGIFNKYPLHQLEVLCLVINNMRYVNMTVFTPLENLTQLDLSWNYLGRNSFHAVKLPSLRYLSLQYNLFTSYIDTCRDGVSLFPNLRRLDLSQNTLWENLRPDPLCLPRLQYLKLRLMLFVPIYVVIAHDSFSDKLFPRIRTVSFSPGPGEYSFTIENHAFRNHMLEHLEIGGIDFSTENVHSGCFAGCPNLTSLDLNGSDFSHVHESKFSHLFSQIPKLASLKLTSTGISRVTVTMFRNLTHLRWLWLDSNRLTEIVDGVFDALTKLKRLDLSTNSLSIVKETTFSVDSLKYLSLSNNPFQCSCELMWFQRWLTAQPGLFNDTVFGQPSNTYTCDNLPNTTVQSFYMADQACLWSPAVSKYIIATFVILLLPLALGTALYRYRWHIRLVLFEANRGRRDRWRRLHEQHFRYDVFVSYDKEDLNWVQGHLMPELEDKMGLRLCIHQRDFILGNPIVENIMESVQISKKTMMVFSTNFVHSQWCQFELQLCLNHVMEQGDSLLVVLLHDIPSRDLTPAMMAVMKTMTYIEWEDGLEARASFWGRIRLALNEILPDV